MKKNLYLIVLPAILLLFSNSCAKSSAQPPDMSASESSADMETEKEDIDPKPEDTKPPKPEIPKQEENVEPDDPIKKERALAKLHHAYAEVLSGAHYGHVLPDGSPLETIGAGESGSNQFAMIDLNGDGEEELVLYCETESAHGAVTYTWNYNTETKELTEYFAGFSPLTFYNNGLAIEEDYRNDTLNWDFSPYTLCQYEKSRNSYTQLYDVGSWNREMYPTDANGDGFPDDRDADGDGVIYMVTNLQTGELSILDKLDFDAWRQGIFGSASPIELSWENLNGEAIMDCVRPYMEFIKVDVRKAVSDTDLALIYMDGEADAVQSYLEDSCNVSFDNSEYEEFFIGTWNGQEVLVVNYEDATSISYLEPMDGVTVLGITPGMSLAEAAAILEAFGFTPEEGDDSHYVTGLGMGNYGVSLEVENGTVISLRFQFQCKYV